MRALVSSVEWDEELGRAFRKRRQKEAALGCGGRGPYAK